MNNLMSYILLSCQKASLLVEKSQEEALSFSNRLKLKMHLKICSKCSDYQTQSVFINRIIKECAKENLSNAKLPEDSKNRIQQLMRDTFPKK